MPSDIEFVWVYEHLSESRNEKHYNDYMYIQYMKVVHCTLESHDRSNSRFVSWWISLVLADDTTMIEQITVIEYNASLKLSKWYFMFVIEQISFW